MLDDLADLLLGARCPGCGRPGLGVCRACRAHLPTTSHPVVDAPALGPLLVRAGGDYDGVLRALLTAHKDRGALLLTGLLGGCLVPGLLALVPGAEGRQVILVPVPSSPAAVRRRGFDHAGALARAAARRVPVGIGGRVVARPVLRRRGMVLDQSGLGRAERAANQAGSMVARPPVPGRAVVLVDDICTTGASLAEAARALRAAGWPVLGAAVVAHPPRRR